MYFISSQKAFKNKGKPIYTPKNSENKHTLRDVYPNVHGVTIHNRQKWKCPLTKERINKTWSVHAVAAAKSLQSCPTLCDPIDGSPSGSAIPGILQERTLDWVAISFSNARKWKVKVKTLGRIRLLATPWTAAHQAPPSMGFSRQEYWSGVPLPSPERLSRAFKAFFFFNTRDSNQVKYQVGSGWVWRAFWCSGFVPFQLL